MESTWVKSLIYYEKEFDKLKAKGYAELEANKELLQR